MNWRSMFDAGACTVSVASLRSYPDNLWSSTLGKGDTSDQFTASGANYQVTVDTGGVVTLLSPDGSGSAPELMLNVAPQYDVSRLQTRMVAIAAQPSQAPVFASNDGYADARRGTAITIGADGAGTPADVTFAATDGAVLSLGMEGLS